MLKAIIFDFDGVICESVEAKTEAFRRLFQDHPQHLEKIIEFHIANGGMSRFEKFKIIYRDFLNRELTPEKSRELGKWFTEYSYDIVVNSTFVTGAYQFLDKYYKKIFLFIASGTPQEEMISIVNKKKLEKYFQGIYGSPLSKAELILTILQKKELDPDQVIFVGDSINDYLGASQTGVRFIGRIHPRYPDPFEKARLEFKIRDLTELDQWMEKQK